MKENIFNIALALDEGYLYPAIVSITSLFENASDTTKYHVTVMIDEDFDEPSREKILSLNGTRHEVMLYNLKQAFSGLIVPGRITKSTYFRLKVPEILKDLKKCLYIDSDTLILKDLSELFDIDIREYYIAGVPEECRILESDKERLRNFGCSGLDYINAGVTLFNIKKINDERAFERIESILLHTKPNILRCRDEYVLNILCCGKILDLHSKFNFYIYRHNILDFIKEDEWKEACENPVIPHHKLWDEKIVPKKYVNMWIEYAKKTKFYEEICKKFKL